MPSGNRAAAGHGGVSEAGLIAELEEGADPAALDRNFPCRKLPEIAGNASGDVRNGKKARPRRRKDADLRPRQRLL